MERSPGFWHKGQFRLVRCMSYDNTQASRNWQPLNSPQIHGVWAWAVQLKDLPEFYDIYSDVDWQTLKPHLNANAFAVSWKQLDAYVCGHSNEEPEAIVFDPKLHCVKVEEAATYCYCGCGRVEGYVSQVENPWAVWVQGPMTRRHKKPAKEKSW